MTSVHGTDRHSYEFSKPDMVFASITFLNSLPEKELGNFVTVFNKMNVGSELKLGKK